MYREHSELDAAIVLGQLDATGRAAAHLGEQYHTVRCSKDFLDNLSIRSPHTNEMSFGCPASEIFTPVGCIHQRYDAFYVSRYGTTESEQANNFVFCVRGHGDYVTEQSFELWPSVGRICTGEAAGSRRRRWSS